MKKSKLKRDWSAIIAHRSRIWIRREIRQRKDKIGRIAGICCLLTTMLSFKKYRDKVYYFWNFYRVAPDC